MEAGRIDSVPLATRTSAEGKKVEDLTLYDLDLDVCVVHTNRQTNGSGENDTCDSGCGSAWDTCTCETCAHCG